MKRRWMYTLAVLAVLAILACFTLDGDVRIVTLIFLGGVALKAYLVVLRSRLD